MGLSISRACQVFSLSVVGDGFTRRISPEDGDLSLVTNKLLVLPVNEPSVVFSIC